MIFLCVGMALWTHLYKYHREYFFDFEKEGITPSDLEEDSNSIIVMSSDWLLVCFAPELYDTNSYYATDYWSFRNEHVLDDIDTNEPCYLILDQRLIIPDDVDEEELQNDPMYATRKNDSFREKEFMSFYKDLPNVEDLEYVGKDSYMNRIFFIYRFVFEEER